MTDPRIVTASRVDEDVQYDEKLLRDVAIKFVPVQTIKDLLDVERLQREMAAAGTMHHPNVVYATDAGEAEGVHYLVMEYVEGIDLSKLVLRVGPLEAADACEIVRQAAEGLAHVQQQQLVHRDLKPSNLMLAADGTIKILDLGLARAPSGLAEGHELTRNGYLLGTIDYIAPEQARDAHSADIRSDIYSLGCTFYKLLTGAPPFGGTGQQSVAGKILAHEQTLPSPLSDHRADVPPAVEQVIRRMLAKDPADRFQSPAELKRAIKPLSSGAALAAMFIRARIAPASSPSPTWQSAGSKGTTIGDKATEKRSTIASLRAAPTRKAAGIGAGVIVCLAVAIALAWMGGWLPEIFDIRAGGSNRPSPTVEDILAAPHSGQIDYPFPQGQPGIQGEVISVPPGGIKLTSEVIQLVRLGYLRDDAKRLSFEVDQSPLWNAQVGVFLGYHEYETTVRDREKKESTGPIGEFQLVLLHRIPDGGGRDYLQAERMRAFIHPTKTPGNPFLAFDPPARSAHMIPLPKSGETLPFVIEFKGRGSSRQMARIEINGVDLDDLGDPRPNLQLTPRDYEGGVGLFSYGNIGGATFSNFDLSHLEKE
jgi:hypothetical protein